MGYRGGLRWVTGGGLQRVGYKGEKNKVRNGTENNIIQSNKTNPSSFSCMYL